MDRYAEYKDSGLEWIGEIPVHWKKHRIKMNYKIVSGNGFPIELQGKIDGELPVCKASDISFAKKKLSTAVNFISYKDADKNKFNIIPSGSIVFAKIGEAMKKNNRAICQVECCLDNNCQALIPNNINTVYSYYLLSCIDMAWFDNAGTIPCINNQKLANYGIPYPPINEQKIIAEYLDIKIDTIDTSIANLQIQLSMLTRYKRDLIAQCVTKGLNKSVPMKASGEDWIGDVPEHWQITKLKWMFEIVKRIYGKEDRDVLAITQQGIKRKDMESNKGQYAESYATYQVVNVNDFAMNSMDLLTGWVDCSPYEGVTSPDYRVFRFYEDKPQCHAYFKYLFQMCYTNRIFYRLGQGVSNLGRWRLQTDQFRNIKLPQPSVEEQERIAAYLDEKTRQIDAVAADIEAQIQKLKDYRRILIHDAVTGKIKI